MYWKMPWSRPSVVSDARRVASATQKNGGSARTRAAPGASASRRADREPSTTLPSAGRHATIFPSLFRVPGLVGTVRACIGRTCGTGVCARRHGLDLSVKRAHNSPHDDRTGPTPVRCDRADGRAASACVRRSARLRARQARAHRAARPPRSRRHRVRDHAGAHRAAPGRRADHRRATARRSATARTARW